jgi:predicted permease
VDKVDIAGRLASVFLPIFGIVAVGFFYGRKHNPEMAMANRINMDIFIPAMVFAAMAGKSFDVQAYTPLALAAFLLLTMCGALAWGFARLAGVPPRTLVPPMMFNNSGNIGLPLAMLAWGEVAMPAAVILFVVENIYHFTAGARFLDPKARLLTLWRVPVVFASLAGVGAALLKLALWQPLMTGIRILGDISIPLMLFSLGVRMTTSPWTNGDLH